MKWTPPPNCKARGPSSGISSRPTDRRAFRPLSGNAGKPQDFSCGFFRFRRLFPPRGVWFYAPPFLRLTLRPLFFGRRSARFSPSDGPPAFPSRRSVRFSSADDLSAFLRPTLRPLPMHRPSLTLRFFISGFAPYPKIRAENLSGAGAQSPYFYYFCLHETYLSGNGHLAGCPCHRMPLPGLHFV